MERIILLVCVSLFLFTGCTQEYITIREKETDIKIQKLNEKFDNDKMYEIIEYKFFGENEEYINANGKIVGFGLYGNGEYENKKHIKNIKVVFRTPTGIKWDNGMWIDYDNCELKLRTFDESHFCIINDLGEKTYNWIEIKWSRELGDYAILHIKNGKTNE